MDPIISKLSEIEAASVHIIDGASADTKKLDEQLQERIASYDQAEDQKMADALSDLKKTLSAQTEEELKNLRLRTDAAIEQMTATFNQQHEKLADEIFNLIRM
ncbi:MAG: hypothetical protein MR543_04780 [Robinsoniella sp.]|nr:hypothetical protein [Robinsoniella sp.]